MAEVPPNFTLVWEPHPGPQEQLLKCPCFEVFFGGARGGGKTDGMLGEFASHADLYRENAIGLMVRRTRTELVETIERSRLLYTQLGAKFNETDKMWRFPNGARLRFAYLERDSDADAYQGHSYTRVYVEEAGTFPSDRPILKLMATLRSGAGVPVGIRLTGNPGGPGQQWVKARYIDPCPGGWEVQQRHFTNPFTEEKISRDWVFIPSLVTDNPCLGGDYIANLQMTGSKQLVKAWLEGDWNVIEGAFFAEWSSTKHVIPPFSIPDDWGRFRSMDWGFSSPNSVGWFAIVGDDYTYRASDGQTRTLKRGCLVQYREWYAPGARLVAEDLALGIKEREKNSSCKEEREHKIQGVLDPSCYSIADGPSRAERMANEGVYFRPADNKRVSGRTDGSGPMGGWDQMRARLNGDAEGHPMIVFFSTCKDSIRTIPVLQHDQDKPEDLDTEAEDHAADMVRYACMSRPYIRSKEAHKKGLPKDYIQHRTMTEPGDWVSY